MGRDKITSTLGEKKIRSFCVYDYEYTQLKNLFNRLKRERYKTYLDEDGKFLYECKVDEKGYKSFVRRPRKSKQDNEED